MYLWPCGHANMRLCECVWIQVYVRGCGAYLIANQQHHHQEGFNWLNSANILLASGMEFFICSNSDILLQGYEMAYRTHTKNWGENIWIHHERIKTGSGNEVKLGKSFLKTTTIYLTKLNLHRRLSACCQNILNVNFLGSQRHLRASSTQVSCLSGCDGA